MIILINIIYYYENWNYKVEENIVNEPFIILANETFVNIIKDKQLPFPWSFLNTKLKDTKIDNFCAFNKKKSWRRKLVNINNIPLIFNILGSNDIVSENIFRYGLWESSIIQTTLRLLKETSKKFGNISYLDIGANIGWFTTVIAKNGYNTIAFEPMNENIEILSNNLCDNNLNNVTVFHSGLGIKEDICWLISADLNMGDGLVKCGTKPEDPWIDNRGYVYRIRNEIKINLLDDYLNSIYINPPIGVMKIDVEGYEENVFLGGLNFLKKYPPYYILIEIIYSYRNEFIHLMYEYDYYIANPDCQNHVLLEKDVDSFMKKYQNYPDMCFVHKNVLK